MNKKITLLSLGLFAVVCNAKSANALSSPLGIDNTDFTVSPGNIGLNNAAGNSTINTTASPNGFGGQFATTKGNTFLLLGAVDVGSGIEAKGNAAINNTNVSAVSPPFTIDADNISAGKLNFKFDYSFQGNNDLLDSFLIGVQPVGDKDNSAPLVFRQGYSDGFVDKDLDVSGFKAGDYELEIFLTESNAENETGSGNSAAGFDNFFISPVTPPTPAAVSFNAAAPTAVPFGAAPNTGIFILGSLYAGSSYLKRRKMSK